MGKGLEARRPQPLAALPCGAPLEGAAPGPQAQQQRRGARAGEREDGVGRKDVAGRGERGGLAAVSP